MGVFNILLGVRVNDHWMVASAPDYPYWGYWHIWEFCFAVTVLVVYCFSFPIASVLVSRQLFVTGASYLREMPKIETGTNSAFPVWMRNADSLHHAMTEEYTTFLYHPSSQATQRHGIVFFPFKPEYHWWKVVINFTRATLGFTYVSLKYFPGWQALSVSFVCILRLALHLYFVPFRSPQVNTVEGIATLCLALLASVKVLNSLYGVDLIGLRVVVNIIMLFPFAWVVVTLSLKYFVCFKKKSTEGDLVELDDVDDLNFDDEIEISTDTHKTTDEHHDEEGAPLILSKNSKHK